MAQSNGDWKTYLLGVLFTVVLGLSSVGFSSYSEAVDTRLTSLETTRTADIGDAREIAVQTAVMAVQIAELTNQITEARSEIVALNRKVNDLTFIISQNTKVYRDAMTRWNEEITRPPAKKN